jgi:uncharacterized protein involved in exopolysaccharide biosynthesis
VNLGKFIYNFILNNKTLFLRSFVFFQALFVSFYIFSDRIYESRADVMSSYPSSNQFLNTFNVFSGMQNNSKSANIFSSIIKSKSFSKNLFAKKILIDDQEISIYEYLLKEYNKSHQNPVIQFEKAYRFFKNELISVRYNKITDIVTIQTYTTNPHFSFELLKSSLDELESRLVQYYLEIAEAKKDFIISRISDVENELIEIEKKYISYLNQNSAISSPNLVISLKRLEREMAIKEGTLVQLASELELQKIESTRANQVVIDIVDSPSLNILKVYPRYSLFLILSLFLSVTTPFILKSKSFLID